jgi:hypothetical protein
MRLKLLAGGAAFVIASAVGLAAVPAGATTSSCNLGEFPVSEASTSNLRVSCVIAGADGGSAIQVNDFNNTAWHDGASRKVTVSNPSANNAVLNVTGANTHINIAGTFSTGSFGTQTGDENRVVEAGFGKLTPGSFIIAESGTGAGGTITLSQPVAKAGSYTLLVENGPGRAVADANYAASSVTLTSATANFVDGSGITSDVGKSIGGTGIPEGDTISAVVNATTVTLTHATTLAGSGATISIGDTTRNSTHRLVNDLAVQTTHIESAMANFQTTDIGLTVVGTGLPANAYIVSVQDAQNATISASATAAAADIVAQIGSASATAPVKDGVDPVVNLQTEIQLDPGLVAGSPACADNIITGTNLQGVWNSPAKFATKRLATDPIFYFNDTHIGLSDPRERTQTMLGNGGPFIGQIQLKTSVVQFAGYVQEDPSTGSASISFPFVPTGLGQCSGTSIASTFDFTGSVLSASVSPTGYGKPGSGSFRVTPQLNFAGASSTGTASYDNFNADSVTLTGVTMNLTTDILTTTAPNTMTDGTVVTLACGANCVAEGLKANTAYYVHTLSSTTFQLDAKPWLPGGVAPVQVPFVKVDIKSSSFTASVFYNTFTHTFGPQTDTCTIARSIPMTNFASTFPCQAG